MTGPRCASLFPRGGSCRRERQRYPRTTWARARVNSNSRCSSSRIISRSVLFALSQTMAVGWPRLGDSLFPARRPSSKASLLGGLSGRMDTLQPRLGTSSVRCGLVRESRHVRKVPNRVAIPPSLRLWTGRAQTSDPAAATRHSHQSHSPNRTKAVRSDR